MLDVIPSKLRGALTAGRTASLVALVVVAAGIAIWSLREGADSSRRTEVILAHVQGDAAALSALEWQAIAEIKATPELLEAVAEERAELDEKLAVLVEKHPSDARIREVRRRYSAFVKTVDQEFRLLAAGRTTEAREFDEERVDPAFEELEISVSAASASLSRSADRARLVSDVGSALTLLAAILIVAALAWRANRARAAQAGAEDTQRMLAAQNTRLRELDSLKDEFVALVSHELRTPLTSILGYLELILEDDGLTDEHRRFLAVVDRNAARLQTLVGDLLFVAQVEAGKMAIALTLVDLPLLARECVEAAGPSADDRGIELTLESEPLLEIPADGQRLAQLLDNLLSNALKFTPTGGQVAVRLASRDGSAVIEVTDSGIGIRAEDQRLLFDRFFRTSEATEQAIQGTGLGLTIVKAIADAHGGSVGLDSVQGAGTTFRVQIPLEPSRSGPPLERALATA